MSRLCACLLVLSSLTGLAQTDRSVQIGLDATKLLLTATNGWPLFNRAVLIEPTLRVPLADEITLTLQPGYCHVTTRTVFRNINQDDQGAYLKLGVEHTVGKHLAVGWQGFVSIYRQSGTFSFPGATFGDYREALPARLKATIGLEPHFDGVFALSSRLELRAVWRLGVGATLGYHADEPRSVYVPGLGIGIGRTFFISTGLGVQVLYRTSRAARAN